MNICPTPISIYKGMKLATATPEHSVLLVSHTDVVTHKCPTDPSLFDQFDFSHLTPKKQTELATLLMDFSDVFSYDNNPMGHTSIVKHSIPTTAPSFINHCIEYHRPWRVQCLVRYNICWIIAPFTPIVACGPPRHHGTKKDNSWQFCINYCKLNSFTCHGAYPLPRIGFTLNSLAGATYFTTLDLSSEYWKVAVEEGNKEKTAFSLPEGHFEFNVMPFGLTNAPITF